MTYHKNVLLIIHLAAFVITILVFEAVFYQVISAVMNLLIINVSLYDKHMN